MVSHLSEGSVIHASILTGSGMHRTLFGARESGTTYSYANSSSTHTVGAANVYLGNEMKFNSTWMLNTVRLHTNILNSKPPEPFANDQHA